MEYVNYKQLTAYYGHDKASQASNALESMTETRNEIITMDIDMRLEKALKILKNINFAANSK